ncbi:MAG: helix-turn-helix transcriptional regulator [Sphingobacteriales bacterium]|nr:helix-turn-helix transcriptional regulator [Sphingobacteriales bacterium]
MDINQKISYIADKYFDGNNVKFAKAMDTSEANIRNYRKSTIPKADFLKKLRDKLEISYEFLMNDDLETLELNMLAEPKENYNKNAIPLIPIDAMAGLGTGEMQVVDNGNEKYVVPIFKGSDFLIKVRGNSMYPKYNSGDIVACKKLVLDTFFQWNKVYVLDTSQGALIKRVRKSESKDKIILFSDNADYSPFEINKSEINALALVMGVIRLE